MSNQRQKPSSKSPAPNGGGNLPVALIETFLENQSLQLKNQSQEIELSKFNEKNSYDYACKALEAQKEDRKERRSQVTLFMKYGFWLTMVLLVLAALFTYGCIVTDNVHIIVSGLKVVAYIFPSAIGGYFVGLNKGRGQRHKNNRSSYEVEEE